MRALCVEGKEQLIMKDLLKPKCEEGCAVIKMVMCGICGSDVTAYRGINPTMKYPIDGIGHEGVGIIDEIDENNDKGLKAGDRVALEPYVPCNKCHMCKVGRFNNCADLRVCGVHKNGMMTEYFVHPVQLLYKIPDTLSFEQATLVEPLTIGLHAAHRARVIAGEYCVIFGAGTIGLLAAFACYEMRATPILVDIVEARLIRAKDLGIEHIFNSQSGDLVEYLKKITNGKLPEAMLECTGSPYVIKEMHNYVCHGGRIALVGWPHGAVEVNTIRCTQKELDIYPTRNSNAQFPTSMKLVNENKIPASKLITKVVTLDEVETTIKDMIKNPENYVKVVVKI